jgi:hypothetical protein
MILTFLIAAHLHYTQVNEMKLQPAKPTVVTVLHLNAERGIELAPPNLTIVKTW